MKIRMAQWPHQELKGTKRPMSRVVHVRLFDRQCTEHWLLFARTPLREEWEREGVNMAENKDSKQKA